MIIKPGIIFFFNIYFICLIELGYSQFPEDFLRYGLPVLPGVTGFGLDSKGGLNGEIIRVTNLNKSGKGSLSEAVEVSGPRIIVFEVAGIIDMERTIMRINNPFVTVAGQTAPFPGITIIKGGIQIQTHDVILQHIKVRPGEADQQKKSGWEIDGIASGGGAYNVIVDHCSITWATDENLSASGPRFEGENLDEWRENTSHKVIFSNCLIAEGLSNSTHSKGEHSKGSLIHDNATEIMIFGNLYVNNMERNPLFKGGVQGCIINNYIYNPGNTCIHYALNTGEWKGHEWITGKMVVEANVIDFGPDTNDSMAVGLFLGPVDVFWSNNKIFSRKIVKELSGSFTLVIKRPIWPEGLVPMPVDEVKDWVLKNSGAFPWERDEIDKRIIDGVKAGTGRIVNSEKEGGTYPRFKPVYKKFNADEWDLISLTKKADIKKRN